MLVEALGWLVDPANWQGPDGLLVRLGEHLWFTVRVVLIAAVIAVPLGLWVGHSGRGGVTLVGAANAMRALPTLGLVTFLFLLSPSTPVLVTIAGLVVLAVPPILAGAYAGVQSVDGRVTDAAIGMGMTGWQRLWQAEVPGSLPLLVGGVRNAALQVVATVTVAAYVGVGGLGEPLLVGLAINEYPQVAAVALVTAVLAVAVDTVLAVVQRLVVPNGLRLAASAAGAT
ncbi:MAG: ABC transporter permease subunit [Pseudonocardiaceae bacterium]|nr:ABC transporter permease subunit [Pseudonocardiaceae bacterium]